MRLWVRLVLALMAVGVVPMLVVGALVIDRADEAAVEQARVDLERDAELRADLVSRSIADQARFLDGWTQLQPERLGEQSDEVQEGLLRAVYLAMPSAVVVALLDGEGLAVVQPQFAEADPVRVSANGRRAQLLVDRAPLTSAIDNGIAIGAPYIPPGSDMPSVPIAALATVADAQTPEDEILVLAAEVQLDTASWLRTRSADNRGLALVSGTGDVFVGADHPLVEARRLSPLAQVQLPISFTYALEDGTEVIGGMSPVAGTPWVLVVVRPSEELTAPAQELRRNILALFFLALSVSLWLGWQLALSLSNPVQSLRDSVLAVADGDYGKRTEVSGSSEIGELARAFNLMSARLAVNQHEIQEQHEQITRFNDELQERVERRTQQLTDAQDQLLRSGQLAAVAEVGAGLAHELNNPLAAILGVAQVLRAQPQSPQRDGLLADLEKQAQRCREVVSAMLRFASGELDPAHAPVVDLREVMADVTTLVEGPFRQRGVSLSLHIDDTPLHVRVDPVHASRILAQILNGLRAGLMDGAVLDVRAEVVEDEVQIVLKPDLPVAVDEFRRDDWMASGMGLWVARRLLDQLGGRLEQPVKVPLFSEMRRPQTEEMMEDPSLPLLQDATWRVVFPRAEA